MNRRQCASWAVHEFLARLHLYRDDNEHVMTYCLSLTQVQLYTGSYTRLNTDNGSRLPSSRLGGLNQLFMINRIGFLAL